MPTVIPVNAWPPRGGTQPVRRRGLRQDRDRRVRLAARPRGRPRRDLLGPPSRPLDAEPGRRPARPRGLPRHGGRHHAGGRRRRLARRPVPPARGRTGSCCGSTVGDPDHGEGADARHLGARPAAHHRARRTARAHPRVDRGLVTLDQGSVTTRRRRGRRALRGVRPPEPAAGPDLAPQAITLQPVRPGSRASAPPSAGTSRRPAPRRREEPALPTVAVRQQPDRLGGDERTRHRGPPCRSRPQPDIKAWSDSVATNPARVPPEYAGSPEVTAAQERLRSHVGPALARLAELSGFPDLAS